MKKINIRHHNVEVKRFDPKVEEGLSAEQVDSMIQCGKVNVAKNPTNKSYAQIIFGNIFTFFNILMVAIAVVLFLIVGKKVVTNLLFLVIIFFNVLIGTVQECKSKRTIEKLKLMNNSKIKVRRGSQDLDVLPTEIVLDDVVILNPGDQIPADCVILESDIIEVNESLLTGESVPVKKSKGEMVYAGSFVVSGSLAVKAEKVGNDTYIQSIENKAKVSKQPKSRLMLAINKIIRTMTVIAIPMAIVVFVNEFLHTITFLPDGWTVMPSSFMTNEPSVFSNATFYGGVTIAYMVPCGMALLASIAMQTGVMKLGQSNTLAQNLYSVESLSRVNTLCLDKTGTLTDGTMMVEDYKIIDKSLDNSKLEQLISSYLSAFKANNQTSNAMMNRFGNQASYKAINTVQFSSARKFSAVKFENLGWFTLGAPEYLTKDQNILDQVNEYATKGMRVVLLCKIDQDFDDEEKIPEKKTPLAMFVIRDNIRPEVKDTMLWFKENDVDIKVISGDNIGTVSYIAKQSGIENWDKVIDMSKITDKDNLEEIVLNNSIFGRVSPDQKADIIAILKKNDRVVGVTGDGLNDLLAFKQADCSIALANGAAATKNVANLVLLDSNFANMKEAVFQGRRVVNNVQRSATLFVMKDYLWLFITIMPILLGLQHMIQPTVISLVNIFITGIASLFVALEPDKTRVTGNFYKNVTKRAITAGFYMFIPIVLIMAYVIIKLLVGNNFSSNSVLAELTTRFENGEITKIGWIPVMALCVTISGFIIFFRNCRPFTKFRKILFGCTIALVAIILYLAPEFFIISGTEMLKETCDSQVLLIFPYVFKHIGSNATLSLFRTMTLEQGIFVIVYFVVSYPIYLLNEKVLGKILEATIFAKREFKDE